MGAGSGAVGVATHEQLLHLYTRRVRAYELSDRYDQALANYEEMQALAQTPATTVASIWRR